MTGQNPKWYVAKNKQRVGPFGFSQLRALAVRGGLLPSDMVWQEGAPRWVRASSLPGLFAPSGPAAPVSSSDEPEGTAAGPQQRPPTQPSHKLKAFLFLLGVCLAVVGLMVALTPILNAWTRSRLGPEVSDTPEEISLERMQARGLTGNPHVVVTHFTFDRDFLTIEKTRSVRKWEEVWIPIRPDGEQPGSRFQAIVRAADVHDEADLAALTARQKLQGLIINTFTSLSSREKDLLHERYPETDFDRVQILQPDRRPPRTSSPAGFYLGGIAMIVCGLVLGYWSGWRNFRKYLGESLAAAGKK